jgi:hypothetical protein
MKQIIFALLFFPACSENKQVRLPLNSRNLTLHLLTEVPESCVIYQY